MRSGISMLFELDHDNEIATLYFGYRDDYVLTLSRENLDKLLDLGAAARREFAARPAE